MMCEKTIPGYEDYKIRITDDAVKLLNTHGKVLTNMLQGNKVWWKLKKVNVCAEDIIASTFPDLQPRDYIYKLYKGVQNRVTGRTRTVELAPNINLSLLYHPTSYMLETPVDVDIRDVIKEMYPSQICMINVVEGNEVRTWREIYFRAPECFRCVYQRFADFFAKT